MRLRSRPRRSREAPEDSDPFHEWTTVGNLGSDVRVRVDRSGRVHVPGHGWILDWWIGAEDRWHRPAHEAAVRQELVGASPVVETRVRIPSGDAVSRVYGARGPRGEDLLVAEVQNDSKVPFALALAVLPHDGGGAVREIGLGGSQLSVDGSSVWLARSPGRFGVSTSADDRTAAEVVLDGDAEPVRPASVACEDGRAQGVLLFPVAHTASLRFAVPLDGTEGWIDPSELPSARQVASGWAAHSSRSARIEVPDRRMRDAVNASARFLLLGQDPSLASIAASARLGGALPAGDAPTIAALVQAWAESPSPGDRARGYLALPAVAELLEGLGEVRAAEDVRTIHRTEASPDPELVDPYVLLASGSPTWTWATERSGHDLAVNAALVLALRNLLVDDSGHELALSPVVPDAWLGMGWEVHDLPTAMGLLSYAVRWHGERPALLWELVPDREGTSARLTAPALDPSWSSTEASGEALLAPVALPERPSQRRGLTIPVTIEPMRRPR